MTALAAPRRAPRRTAVGWRAAHGVGWLAGVFVFVASSSMPVAVTMLDHPRAALADPGVQARDPARGGADRHGGRPRAVRLVRARPRTAPTSSLSHGSGGSRGRLVRHIQMLARNGYGVLALDNPGNGESEGHSNGLGGNAQPAIDAALDYLAGRPGVDPARIAGVGSSLGGEVLLEATARDPRLRAVVSDGAMRPQDGREHLDAPPHERVGLWIAQQAIRGVSGMRPAPSLTPLMPRIAPRPALLIAGGKATGEVPTNRDYRAAGGPSVELWEVPDTGHTGGLRTPPEEYEARVIALPRPRAAAGAPERRAPGADRRARRSKLGLQFRHGP